MNASAPPAENLAPLVESLIAGFEDLLTTLHTQIEDGKSLREKLDFAADEYEKLLNADGAQSASSVALSQVVAQIRQPPSRSGDLKLSQRIQSALDAINVHRVANRQQTETKKMARCPVSHAAHDLEQDFTTHGVQGTLGCPFAKMSNGLASVTQEDPIAAEFHQDRNSALSIPADQRPGQCPIRFLDQHSPEEIAKYFENHKHEIPRSHEICVRRYQGNESSARQLDAKYGSLVNMIQGLGIKHKAYLPERDRIEERDKSSDQAVEKWAEDVSHSASGGGQEITVSGEEPRRSRFEKPLREVRVGESPSRPWGISVPADKEPAPSALQSEDEAAHPETKPESRPPPPDAGLPPQKCPVDHAKKTEPQNQARPEVSAVTDHRTHIVFNGPVFFGYSAEQVSALLQTTNLANLRPSGE